jgi:hypothetical protein
VGAVTGSSLPWMRASAKRDNTQGAAGSGDGRHRTPGHVPLLSAEPRHEVGRVLDGPSPEGGRWRGPVAGGGRRWPPGSPRSWAMRCRPREDGRLGGGAASRRGSPGRATPKPPPRRRRPVTGGGGSSREGGPSRPSRRAGRAVDDRRAPPRTHAAPPAGGGPSRPARARPGPPPRPVEVPAGLRLPPDRPDPLGGGGPRSTGRGSRPR